MIDELSNIAKNISQELSQKSKYPNAYQYQYKDERNVVRKMSFPAMKTPKDKNMGVFLIVVGSIMAVPAFGLSLATFIMGIVDAGKTVMAVTTVVGIPFLAIAVICMTAGVKKTKKVSRFYAYINVLKEKNFANIAELANRVSKKEEFVRKELQQMSLDGWFFEGHMDRQNKCFISSNEIYEQYCIVDKERQVLALEEKKRLDEIQSAKDKATEERELLYNNPEGRQLLSLLEEGRAYVAQIKAANELILGRNFSEKLDRLELVCSKIFEQVKKKPEKMPEIRKFMNYYLPTTLKLVNAYYEFDKQPVQGDNMIKSKRDIEASVDKINLAFENLFDQLFHEDAMDISTDIEVLSTMLSQEGLLGSAFDKK